jgi:hypothetical protein
VLLDGGYRHDDLEGQRHLLLSTSLLPHEVVLLGAEGLPAGDEDVYQTALKLLRQSI